MRRVKKGFLLCLLACVLAAVVGCGKVSTDSLQKLERAGDGSAKEETVQPLAERNELPEDGVISAEQLATIAGKDGVYEFYATDEASGIQYIWSYDGAKIQNAVEQRLKVGFVTEGLDEIKKAANNATVGLGVTLEEMSLAAPATLKLILPEKWDADAAVLCKMADGQPAQMAEVEIGTEQSDGKEVTTMTFPVLETGDTYYVVGGKTIVDGGDASGEDAGQADGKAGVSGTSDSQNTDSKTDKKTSKSASSGKKGDGGSSGGTNQKSDASVPSAVHTCTISIDCKTLANHIDKLRDKEKLSFVPEDGWLLYASEVEFTPGDTVYDVLYDACKRAGYQMEASYTPMYGSYYIEGINQLYEFDGGELSGWMYSVNGWYPNYGCSSYTVSDGDVIKWRYTLDLGKDIGGSNVIK